MSSNAVKAGEAIEGVRRQSGTPPYDILIVDDDAAILETLELTLGPDYRIHTAENGPSALEVLEREEIALIIADQVLPSMPGVEFLERAIEIKPRAIRILLTGYPDIGSLTRAVNEGRIYRYIAKPWEPDEIRLTVKRALEVYELATENNQLAAALAEANERLRAENRYLRREVERKFAFDKIIGTGPAMERVFDVMEKVAETDATVLISGETGTGRDLIARAIHYAGPRKERRFVAQSCASASGSWGLSLSSGSLRLARSAYRRAVYRAALAGTGPSGSRRRSVRPSRWASITSPSRMRTAKVCASRWREKPVRASTFTSTM